MEAFLTCQSVKCTFDWQAGELFLDHAQVCLKFRFSSNLTSHKLLHILGLACMGGNLNVCVSLEVRILIIL